MYPLVFYAETLEAWFEGRIQAFLNGMPTDEEISPNSICIGCREIEIEDDQGLIFEYGRHNRGDKKKGNDRTVLSIIRAADGVKTSDGLIVHAGVTIHDRRGTWSSYPPHGFEQAAMAELAPRPFIEYFAYLTDPPGLWGIQTTFNHETGAFAEIFQDRDIKRIPLGPHPVVARPGVRLSYVWVYAAPPGMDKF